MGRTFAAKQVMAVLARAFEVRPEHLSSLDARLLHLKRVGLTPAKTTSGGSPIVYSRSDVMKWALHLQIGLVFETGRAFVLGERVWRATSEIMLGHAPEPSGDWYLYLAAPPIAPPLVIGQEDRRVSFVVGAASDAAALQASFLSLTVFNLSRLRRAVDGAIDAVADASAPQRGRRREPALPARKRREPEDAS